MTKLYNLISKPLLLLTLCASMYGLSCSSEPSDDSHNNDKETTPPEEVEENPIYTYTPQNSTVYTLIDKYSAEFDSSIDETNWDISTDIFAAWSFKKENVTIDNGVMNLTAKYDKHKPGAKQFYFSSGMLRSKETVGYGYYEAKIKGADLWPGVCPAFWLYTILDKDAIEPRAANTLVYNEIDIIEIQQIASNKRMMACNMHIMAMKPDGTGDFTYDFITAGKLPKMGQNEFLVDWDAEDDYHIYGCENRPDSVVFYIDGERVASKPNFFWHMEMHLTLSMGMRTPYESYEGDRHAVETSEADAIAAGFPTSMKIDYIRSYKRDYSKFPSSKKAFDESDFK